MAKKTIRTVKYRRKRENKTNYYKRLNLLKSNRHRVVIRLFSNTMIIQLVEFQPKGDKTLINVNSSELKKFGWKHSCKNLPACYLTGLLFSKKAKDENFKEGIVDFGFRAPLPGSRLYSALKGIVDGGFNVPVDKNIFPDEKRLNGEHINDNIKKDFEEIKSKI